ncbi:MAG: MarR family transcriptional regulator [Candidatus Gracilibacteria bacterium]
MPKDINEKVIKLFFELGRVIRSRALHKCCFGLNMSQLFAIMFIKENKAKMRDISNMLGIRDASATSLIDGLAKAGYVQRKHDKKDRREVNLSVTKKADSVIDAAWKNNVANFLALESLTNQELIDLEKILIKLKKYSHE